MDVEEAGADAAAIPVIPSAGALSDDDMEYEFDSSLSDASSGSCSSESGDEDGTVAADSPSLVAASSQNVVHYEVGSSTAYCVQQLN